ncbi:hypothetical protein [Frankia gtarii]|uniref:hypothetical protein n=1 Tax=Frankia gtarii TaxID=2950102 RepID=UPI0021C04414|nr:hypothetical protein [Frankia gtarii]
MEDDDSNAPLPEIEISDEDVLASVDAALADYEAGRYVVCDPETFERLLTGAPYLADAG